MIRENLIPILQQICLFDHVRSYYKYILAQTRKTKYVLNIAYLPTFNYITNIIWHKLEDIAYLPTFNYITNTA